MNPWFPRQRAMGWAALLAVLIAASGALAQDAGTRAELYGHVMLDMGYGFRQSDPSWFDVVRPTKLPAFDQQFGHDGRWFSSVRQSRMGVRTYTPTTIGELSTLFEFELFGVGVDAGQTTFRLRHAYGQLGHFGAGQTWSPFMDSEMLPSCLDHWGPNGMPYFRNVQVRWMPIQGDTRMTVALERPGASGDQGAYRAEIEAQGVEFRFPLPDVSAEYRIARPRGYIELAGILRYVDWDDTNPDTVDASGDAIGWGVNVTSTIKLPRLHEKDLARLGVVYGAGIQNYINDSSADIGVERTGDTVDGKALPILGFTAFLEHYWNDRWSTTAGYSLVDIDNSNGQNPDAYHRGHYALGNLLYRPVLNVMMGAEFQWARRENNSDGFTADDYRIQFSAKYNFAARLSGQ